MNKNQKILAATAFICFISVLVILPFGKPASPKILCLGDSITYGGNVDTPYPETLQSLSGISTTNAGVNNEQTSDMLTRWNNDYRWQGYSILVLLGGTNDISYHTPLSTTTANLYAIISDALTQGCTVYSVTVLPFSYVVDGAGINSWIRSTVPTMGAHVIDVYSAFDDPANPGCLNPIYAHDAVHPNQAGTDLLAQLVYSAIVSSQPTPTPSPTIIPTPMPSGFFWSQNPTVPVNYQITQKSRGVKN
jgi:lysophospholipase L1-like esterase